jgi:hypothetical protein
MLVCVFNKHPRRLVSGDPRIADFYFSPLNDFIEKVLNGSNHGAVTKPHAKMPIGISMAAVVGGEYGVVASLTKIVDKKHAIIHFRARGGAPRRNECPKDNDIACWMLAKICFSRPATFDYKTFNVQNLVLD